VCLPVREIALKAEYSRTRPQQGKNRACKKDMRDMRHRKTRHNPLGMRRLAAAVATPITSKARLALQNVRPVSP